MKNIASTFVTNNIRHQQGFTLIELMISLVLGLLISAAVMQVFLTSQRVDRIQTAASEIQDKAVFGLQAIEPQVRLANLGNDGVSINDITVNGGIVLTAGKFDSSYEADEDSADDSASASTRSNVMTKNNLRSGFLTRSGDMATTGNTGNRWNGSLTNTGVSSDQLTIQYINTTGRTLYDCEGEEVAPNARVITRYFIKEDSDKTKKDRKNLNLNCDAGRIIDNRFTDFANKNSGQTIIENIDQFNIRLGTQQSIPNGSKISYQYADMTVAEYMALIGDKPPIVNIRIAVLARSTANSPEASTESFEIFGSTQTLKTQTDAPKYLRRVYETNILLRNARIMRIIDSSAP
ncbi:PilW family protein [Psychrobacter sp. 16-MNA-CIBAN-0192]|uniref:PilW family protein n=1 Tax=Psychrobacter sp. 16-MNA-CIBAN-0192 TaxID=3140448 RepID=UPI00331E0B61